MVQASTNVRKCRAASVLIDNPNVLSRLVIKDTQIHQKCQMWFFDVRRSDRVTMMGRSGFPAVSSEGQLYCNGNLVTVSNSHDISCLLSFKHEYTQAKGICHLALSIRKPAMYCYARRMNQQDLSFFKSPQICAQIMQHDMNLLLPNPRR